MLNFSIYELNSLQNNCELIFFKIYFILSIQAETLHMYVQAFLDSYVIISTIVM